jgi:hypothetical protein
MHPFIRDLSMGWLSRKQFGPGLLSAIRVQFSSYTEKVNSRFIRSVILPCVRTALATNAVAFPDEIPIRLHSNDR